MNEDDIAKAIGAHGIWKSRLKTAIEKRELETPIETIRMDGECELGKWLQSPTLTSVEKASNTFRTVKQLHIDFHRTAARVAELAMAGKSAEAGKMMALGGEFTELSAKLTTALREWKKKG